MEHTVETSDATISYDLDGPADAPALLFLNSIGSTRDLWSRQRDAFSAAYRVVRYDARGHGRSSVPPGDYTIEQLGQDALAIFDAEGIESAHVCGLSLGGLTAMWLGAHASPRVKSLVLANTAARIGSLQSWTERIALVREHGMAAVAERAMLLWFSEEFRDRAPGTVEQFRTMLQSCPPAGYLGCCAALRDTDLRETISGIRCPVLAVAGSSDMSTPVDALQFVQAKIAGARMVTLESAHLSNVEQADAFTSSVLKFLSSLGPN